jgi:acetyl esterase/lipase
VNGDKRRRLAPVDLLNATISTRGLTLAAGIAYGPDARHRLDVYRPAAASALPVVVFFYGGAWQTGHRQDYPFVAAALARAGMVVAVPDYRKLPQARFPAFLHDCARAVAFVRRMAPRWGGDPSRVFLVGHSAGAYNAAMLALDPRYLDAAGDSRAALAGMAGLAGPYDFLPLLTDDIRDVFRPAADLRETQPIHHADRHGPPMLLLHGARDNTCYPRNALALAMRVRAAGGVAEARIYPRVGHIGIVLGFVPYLRWLAPTWADVVGFVSATKPGMPNPPKPEDTADVDALFSRHYAAWAASLSGDEAAALDGYKGGEGRRVNDVLRGGRADPLLDDMIALLSGALARASAPRAMRIWRGVSTSEAEFYRALPAGAQVTIPAFVSASLEMGVATRFAAGGEVVEILVADGTVGVAYIHPVPRDRYRQHEVLVTRGTAFRVARADADQIVLEIVHAARE